jgi:hypothetical protein
MAVRAMFEDVTRIHVVNTDGPEIVNKEFWADDWHISLQDEGRTLKIIGSGTGAQSLAERDGALAAFVAQYAVRDASC